MRNNRLPKYRLLGRRALDNGACSVDDLSDEAGGP